MHGYEALRARQTLSFIVPVRLLTRLLLLNLPCAQLGCISDRCALGADSADEILLDASKDLRNEGQTESQRGERGIDVRIYVMGYVPKEHTPFADHVI